MSYNVSTSDLPPAAQMFSDIGFAGGSRPELFVVAA
jgi:hypothetical protein